MRELFNRLLSPEPLSVVTFMFGLYCLTTALGITTGLRFGTVSFLSPSPGKKEKLLLYIVGGGLIAFSIVFSMSLPVYKPVIFKERIYAGRDAKQVVADGDDIYFLKEDGIFKLTAGGLQLIDSGIQTKQIIPAGGVLYILKDNGNIWAYVSVTGRKKEDPFRKKDVGTNTKQIVSAGEVLYILKDSGKIWKYYTRPRKDGKDGKDRKRIVDDEFELIDPGTNTREIASSGSVLYILKESGIIWQYVPTLEKPFDKIYQEKDAKTIVADGGTLYFIKNDGSTWKYKEHISAIEKREIAKEIDAVGGIVYILTVEGGILRYNASKNSVRKLEEAGKDNLHIAAYGQDVFVIKENGGVWRYNEFLVGR